MPEPTKNKNPNLFLRALVFSLCFTLLYAVFVLIVPKSGYDLLGYIYLSPVAIIGSFIFYFIYIFFKRIEKLKWLFGSVFIIILFLLYNSGFIDADIWIKNKLHFDKLPVRYENFQEINQPEIKFGNKKISQLLQSQHQIETFLNSKNELIIRTEKDSILNDDNQFKIYDFMKLDTSGTLISTYRYTTKFYKNDEVLFQGFIINPNQNYYKTWAIDGDTIRKKMEVENEDTEWTKETQTKFYQDIIKNADYFMTGYDFYKTKSDSTHVNYLKIIYKLPESPWKVFYKTDRDDGGYPYANKGETFNDLFRFQSSENIQSLYFEKKKLRRIWQGGGGGSSATPSDVWQGNLYTQMIIDRDTLKFKEEFLLDEEWKFSDVMIDGKNIGSLTRFSPSESYFPFKNYQFYSNPKLNYQLFKTAANRLHIIKPIDGK